MKNKLKILFVYFLLMTLFPGCIQKKVYVSKLQALPAIYEPDFQENQDNICLKIKQLDSNECKNFLGVNTFPQGILPIVLSIKNCSNDIIFFNPESTGLPLLAPYDVAKRCHWQNLEITSTTAYFAALFLWQALIPISMCSYKMRRRNSEITESIMQHAISSWESIKILPLETLKKVMFIESIYVPQFFTISIFNKSKKETKQFFVELKK